MKHRTLNEARVELTRLYEQATDPQIKKVFAEALVAYYQAEIDIRMQNDSQKNKMTTVIAMMVCYLVVILPPMVAFLWKGLLGIPVTIACFALSSLMMGVFLRLNGDISEKGLLAMTTQGFKALLLLRRKNP